MATSAVAVAPAGVLYVNRGDTLHSIARQHHIPVAELARANNLDQSARLSLGMKLVVPGAKTAMAAPAPVAQGVAAAPVAVAPAPAMASREAAVRDFVERWRHAWESGDLDRYLTFYDPTFRSGAMDLAAWRAHKRSVFARAGTIRVEVEGLTGESFADRLGFGGI